MHELEHLCGNLIGSQTGHIHAYLIFFFSMLTVLNPLGNAAIFVGLSAGRSLKEKHAQARTAAIAIFCILILATWTGRYILEFFGISPAAFEAAGGLIILRLGLNMILGNDSQHSRHAINYSSSEHKAALKRESIAVVPVAIPLFAGPGAITTIIIHTSNIHHDFFLDRGIISLLCLLLALIIFGCLYYSTKVSAFLGDHGMKVVIRIMGLILSGIAFQMLYKGILTMFPALH